MSKHLQCTTIHLKIYHEKDIPNLGELVAQRAYTLDGVREVAKTVDNNMQTEFDLEQIQRMNKSIGYTS